MRGRRYTATPLTSTVSVVYRTPLALLYYTLEYSESTFFITLLVPFAERRKIIMKKIFKRMFLIIISTVILCNMFAISANAAEYHNDISYYSEIIKDFNSKYGTNYRFAEDVAVDSEDIEPILKMSYQEFWDYLYDAHMAASSESDESFVNEDVYKTENEKSANSVINMEQRYYYDGNSNRYIEFYMDCVQVNGTYRYDSLTGYCSVMNSYPARRVTNIFHTSISNSGRNISIVFSFKKYITNIIELTGIFYDSVTFTAGAGDVWIYPFA